MSTRLLIIGVKMDGQQKHGTKLSRNFIKGNNMSISHFTKTQIQDKEREMKRDYRLLKDANNQSGAHFDEKIGRITTDPTLWKNILTSHPKAKKFCNKYSPLYEALGSFVMVILSMFPICYVVYPFLVKLLCAWKTEGT
jgi:hypothetical protein